jgi:hypothetical protein
MIISVVADPLAFERSCFDTPGYRQQAELFLRGISSNGLLVVDSDAKLQREMVSKIRELPSTLGQYLSIRLEELLKNKRARIVRCHPGCGVIQTSNSLDLAWSVFERCTADALISTENRLSTLKAKGKNCAGGVPLASYSGSTLEDERNRFLGDLPPIDTLDSTDIEDLFLRIVRFARWLRFYDKQIGKGQNTSNFREGIKYMLELWQRNGHFASQGDVDFVEIITCQKERISPSESSYVQGVKRDGNREAYNKVVDQLLVPLRRRFPWDIKLKVKDEGDVSFHARHLQAQTNIILVDAGFDLFVPGSHPRRFKRNILKIDNGSFAHLQDYRKLPDAQL